MGKKTFRPGVERLDDRIVPATNYYWRNYQGDGLWSDAGDWSMSQTAKVVATKSPSAAGDIAVFDNQSPDCNLDVSVACDVMMPPNPNNPTSGMPGPGPAPGAYGGTLHLHATLNVVGQNTVLASGSIDIGPWSEGAIDHIGSSIVFSGFFNTLSGTNFVSSGGNNSSNVCGELVVGGGMVRCSGAGFSCVGDILVQGDSNSNTGGTLVLGGDQSSNMTGNITLTGNQPAVSVSASGQFTNELEFAQPNTTGGTGGGFVSQSQTPALIGSSGTNAAIVRDQMGQVNLTNCQVQVMGRSSLIINQGTLYVNSEGAISSVIAVSGFVVFGGSSIGGPSTLSVSDPVDISGRIEVVHGCNAVINGTVNLASQNNQEASIVLGVTPFGLITGGSGQVALLTVNGNVNFNSGSSFQANFDYENGGGCDQLNVSGVVTIDSSATLYVTYNGGVQMGWNRIIKAPEGNIDGDFGKVITYGPVVTGAQHQKDTTDPNWEYYEVA